LEGYKVEEPDMDKYGIYGYFLFLPGASMSGRKCAMATYAYSVIQ